MIYFLGTVLLVRDYYDVEYGGLTTAVLKYYDKWTQEIGSLLPNLEIISMSHSSSDREASILVQFKTTTPNANEIMKEKGWAK